MNVKSLTNVLITGKKMLLIKSWRVLYLPTCLVKGKLLCPIQKLISAKKILIKLKFTKLEMSLFVKGNGKKFF